MPSFLKPYFWDVDFEKVNLQTSKEFIITRLLEKGRVECISWLNQNYSKKEIHDIIKLNCNLSIDTKNLALELFK